MLRFFHVLYLNAWRGMRRANGTPAIIITLIAAGVLFIGSNASARASIQTAMHVVGLPGALAPVAADSASAATSGKTDSSNSPHTDSANHNDGAAASDTSAKSNTDSRVSAGTKYAQSIPATVSLIPSTIAPVCNQGVMQYSVQTAQLSLPKPTSAARNFNWSIETKIDIGSAPTTPPLSNASHSQFIDAGVETEDINPSDPSQPLINASANANYTYSFRVNVTGPFVGSSVWVGVPQQTSACS